MRVDTFQAYLRALCEPLKASGCASKYLNDIESTAKALDPFASVDFGQLAEWVQQVRTFKESGEWPQQVKPAPRTKPQAPKPDPVTLTSLIDRIIALEVKAASPENDLSVIEREIEELGLLSPRRYKKDDLLAVAKTFKLSVSSKTGKEDAFRLIRRHILGRRDTVSPDPTPAPTPLQPGGPPPQTVPLSPSQPALISDTGGSDTTGAG
jgi:hypothetical protein